MTIVRVARDGRKLECWESGGDKPIIAEPPESPYFYSPLLELPEEVAPFADMVKRARYSASKTDFQLNPKTTK
ncbi:MAG: hypothetical protein PVH12_05865 [Candidatus Bathyarchaeota archaeon]